MNFERCLTFTLRWEAGYVNHPKDPGGATNRGITQVTYHNWLLKHGRASRPVASITGDEVRAIYREEYWNLVRGDELPWPLDLAVFDYALNSGHRRAIRAMQGVLIVLADGLFGDHTLLAVNDYAPRKTALSVCDQRLAFMKMALDKNGAPAWPTFGHGWTNRLNALKDEIGKP